MASSAAITNKGFSEALSRQLETDAENDAGADGQAHADLDGVVRDDREPGLLRVALAATRKKRVLTDEHTRTATASSETVASPGFSEKLSRQLARNEC